MTDYSEAIRQKIRTLRLAKNLKQSELDKEAGLPTTSISKIESGKRELAAKELPPIARALGVTPETLLGTTSEFVYNEEKLIVQALREIPFDDYKRIVSQIEAAAYFTSKDATEDKKEDLHRIVDALTRLTQADTRPRIQELGRKKVRNQ